MDKAEIFPMSSAFEDQPVGTAFLPRLQLGVDLAAHGYVEEEFLVQGRASVWSYDEDLEPVTVQADLPYTTRVLVRRPREATASSGLVQVEPLHPDLDSAVLWNAIHPWLLRGGHTWMGVTVYPHTAAQLRDTVEPRRYAQLSIPHAGQEFDIVGSVLRLLRRRGFAGVRADHIMLGGMSATGSFCRVFSQDGFHERWSRAAGRRIVDGYVIGISSSGAGVAGFPVLSPASAPLPAGDARMVAHGHGAVVFEVLSETESETHANALREDSDAPDDRYRLYQPAGTAHIEKRPSVLTNQQQYERAGLVKPIFVANEPRSDARFDLFLRALCDWQWRWICDPADVPPRGGRFAFAPTSSGPERELRRDEDGNVEGGVRTPWVEVPTAAYHPHSTAASESERPPEWTPFGGPEVMARLFGSRSPFSATELRRRYGSRAAYLERFEESVRSCVASGFLLGHDADELLREAPARWIG